MVMALRFADPLAPLPFELRHPHSNQVKQVGLFELTQIGDCDITALTEQAMNNPQRWVEFEAYKPFRTLKPYR